MTHQQALARARALLGPNAVTVKRSKGAWLGAHGEYVPFSRNGLYVCLACGGAKHRLNGERVDLYRVGRGLSLFGLSVFDVYGEGLTWEAALADAERRCANAGKIENPKWRSYGSRAKTLAPPPGTRRGRR
ncbi:MAG TPA: hypothetical protein VNI83_06035 [Vicinamibacterales bacterium]|nr:hypothetical protein [Vicinamibacterales bacterium]